MKKKFSIMLAVLLSQALGSISAIGQNTFEKVTSSLDDWSGEYLLVYENDESSVLAWTGVDAVDGCMEMAVSNGVITGTPAVTITIAPMEEGYSIQVNGSSNDGMYIYGQDGSNALKFSDTPALNSIEYDGESAMIVSFTSVMRFNSASNQMRFRYYKSTSYSNQQPVQLYKKNEGGPVIQVVSTPSFSPAAGTYYEPQQVSIQCATAGASIYYTLDGSTPTTGSMLYTTPITISETTTVKAMGVKAGMQNSGVASATYTIQESASVITIAEARALELNEYALVQGVVTFIDGRNVYVQDATAGIDLYLNSNPSSDLSLGDMVQAYGKKAVYKGLVELSGIDPSDENQFSVLSTGNALPMVVKTIAEINEDHESGLDALQSTRLKIVGATVGVINTANNTPITQGDQVLNIYKMPVVEGLEEGDVITVTGVLGCYNAPQLRINSANDVETSGVPVLTVATPVITPEGGAFGGPVEVSISCSTEGATIHYTLDGSQPTASSLVYSAPFTLNASATVKAMATKTGYENSPVATASFEISIAAPVTFSKVHNSNDIAENVSYLMVCEIGSTAASGLVQNNALQTVSVDINADNTILTAVDATGLPCTFVLEATEGGYFVNVNGNYLNNASGTGISLGATASSVWAVNAYEDGYILQNTSNNDRFIGGATAEGLTYKAYATSNLGNEQYPVVVLYKEGESSPMLQVETPVITPAGGLVTAPIEVSISCATTGAVIYYTLDGTEPTLESSIYTVPFTISEPTTVQAMAAKAGMTNSAVASETYTFPAVMSIRDARGLENGQFALVGGVVTFIDGRNIYIQDGTGGIVLYLNNNTVPANLAIGDLVEGYGKKSVFRGLVELSEINGLDESCFRVLSSGNALPLAVKTIEECLAGSDNDLQSTRVLIQNAVIGAINTGGNTPLTQGDQTINIYKIPALPDIEEDSHVNVIAVIGYYNAAQLRVAYPSDVVALNANLFVTPMALNGFTYEQGEGPSAPQSLTLSGQYLAANVTLTANQYFELSETQNGPYTSTLSLATVDGILDEKVVYVRLMGGLTMNNYESSISVVSGEDEISVSLSGNVTISNAVATPSFSPEPGHYMSAQTVSITCATEGAVIRYTLDGSDPNENSMVYTEPITVSTSTVINAMGFKQNWMNSLVASASYEILTPITIAEARQLANNQYATVEGVVTLIDNRNIYVQDNTAGIVLYLNNNTVPAELAVGDRVRCNGKKSVYSGLVELTGVNGNNENELMILSSGNPLPLKYKTIAQLQADYAGDNLFQATRVMIVNAIIRNINHNGNSEIVQGNASMNIYKIPVVEGLEAGDYVTVTGVVGCFNAVQLLVAESDDVSYTHRPTINVAQNSLSGFEYDVNQGPSEVQVLTVNGEHLNNYIRIVPSENFEISAENGEAFTPTNAVLYFPENSVINGAKVYVRMKAGLPLGQYSEALTISSEGADEVSVICSGNVHQQGGPVGNDWRKIYDLSELVEGSRIIIAARYDNENTDSYYAMTASTSGKPTGVLFTSTMAGTDEVLPTSITNEAETYCWTVGKLGNLFTLTNNDGSVLGYTSSTNFSPGGDNIGWSITEGTSIDTGVMVSNYSAFNIINGNVTNRAAALNSNHNYGPYSTSNMANGNGANYNFYLDIFISSTGSTPFVNAPVFTPEAGTYYEALTVSIECATEDAVIYYSTVSDQGPWIPYNEPIYVANSMTLYAYAEKEGYNNSAVVSAEYIINAGMTVLFNQDWEGDWNGWTNVSVVGNYQWGINSYGGNHYAYANAYNQGANEAWLISPAFDLDSYTDVVLSFRTARNYNGPDIEVYFSNDYDGIDPTTATWQPITCELSAGSWNWVETGELSMDGFSGNNCYIAFRYLSTEDSAAGWEVDDIMLYSNGGGNEDPYLVATPNALSGFVHMEEAGPSQEQTFVLTGGNLPPFPGSDQGSVLLSIPSSDGFEISLDGENYSTSASIEVVGTLEPTPVYVRLNGDHVGQYNEEIVIEGSGDVTITVTLSGEVQAMDVSYIDAFMPLFIQGNNGSNNNRVPVAIATYIYNLEPNTTYRYVNQFVDDNDGPDIAGAGNVIYAHPDGFYRTTSPSLSTEGGYGEFTTDDAGEGFAWFINEPTANTRFTPGNHVYLRIRLNDGHDGTTVSKIFTTADYATVLNFGTEAGENQGTAFYAASEESPMNFVMLFSDDNDFRPTYSTSIEATGIDFTGINQYADFYQEEVSGKNGYFGGILPNDNAEGINIIWILDLESYVINDFYTENGLWGEVATANPTGGLDQPIFIDLIGLSVEEGVALNVKAWNYGHEIMIENAENTALEMGVYNLLGQPVMNKTIAASSSVRIPHNLADGLYVITLQNATGKMSAKIVVR